MSSREARIIYGTYLTPKACKEMETLDEEGYGDDYELMAEEYGFKSEYSASGDEPIAWLGKKIQDLDTFNNVNLQEFDDLTITTKQLAEVEANIAAIPESVRNLLPTAQFYIIWYDS